MPTKTETKWNELFTGNDAQHFSDKTIDKMSALLKKLPRADAVRVVARGLEQNPDAWRDIRDDLRRLLYEEEGMGEVAPELAQQILRHVDGKLGNVSADLELVKERVAFALGAPRASSKSAEAAPPPERPLTAHEMKTWKAFTAEVNSVQAQGALTHQLLNFYSDDAHWTEEERRNLISRVGAHVGDPVLPAEWRQDMLSMASTALRKASAEEAETLRGVMFDAAVSGVLREANPVILEALGAFMNGQRHFDDRAVAAALIAGAKREPSEGDRWLVALGRCALDDALDFLLERATHAPGSDERGYALVGLSNLPSRMLLHAQERCGELVQAAITSATSNDKRFHAWGTSAFLAAASAAGLVAALPEAQQQVVHAYLTLGNLSEPLRAVAFIVGYFRQDGLPADPPLTAADILAVCDDMIATYEACRKTLGITGPDMDAARYVRDARASFAEKKHEVNPNLDLRSRMNSVQEILDWKKKMEARGSSRTR